jgi:hypothetical protein
MVTLRNIILVMPESLRVTELQVKRRMWRAQHVSSTSYNV